MYVPILNAIEFLLNVSFVGLCSVNLEKTSMKDLLKIGDESDITCFDSYKRIADKLMNDYRLQVRNTFYRIVECEFYYSSQKHNDPYVHGHERQKNSCGEWYFHGSGLDITLSNEQAYGGILLRGIAAVNTHNHVPAREDAIIGPLNVCTEIFKQIGNVLTNAPLDFGLVDISAQKAGASIEDARVFSIPRIGLNNSKDNDGAYCSRPYRFISFLHLPHKDAEKVKHYLTAETGGKIGIDEYKQYYKKERW
jgi:hypothetical protein